MNSRANKPSNSSDSHSSFGLPIGRAGLLFSERPVSLRSSGLPPLRTVLKIRTFEATYDASGMRFCRFPLDRRGHLISNSSCRGSNPTASASHSCVRPGFPRDARMGQNPGFSRIRFGLCTPGSPVFRRKSSKVSGRVCRYSRFAETFGGDRFDHDCRPTMALCPCQFAGPDWTQLRSVAAVPREYGRRPVAHDRPGD
jgi:hypothetical protein